jgi:hypothetical protein
LVTGRKGIGLASPGASSLRLGGEQTQRDSEVGVSSNYELIRAAITERQQVFATYQGKRREMCPHALGSTNGRSQALFFQFGGESSRPLPPGGQWRCLAVDELDGIELHEGAWHSGDGHSRTQSCVDIVDVEVG